MEDWEKTAANAEFAEIIVIIKNCQRILPKLSVFFNERADRILPYA